MSLLINPYRYTAPAGGTLSLTLTDTATSTGTSHTIERGSGDMLYVFCVQGNREPNTTNLPAGVTEIAEAGNANWTSTYATYPVIQLYRWEGVTGTSTDTIEWTTASDAGVCIAAIQVTDGASGLVDASSFVSDRGTDPNFSCPDITAGISSGDIFVHCGSVLQTALNGDPNTITGWDLGTQLTNLAVASGSRRPRLEIWTGAASVEAADTLQRNLSPSVGHQCLGVSFAVQAA